MLLSWGAVTSAIGNEATPASLVLLDAAAHCGHALILLPAGISVPSAEHNLPLSYGRTW